MNWWLPFVAGLLCLAHASENLDTEERFNMDDLDDLDEELLRELEKKSVKVDMDKENAIAQEVAARAMKNAVVEVDPCEKMHCSAGRICQLNGTQAKCVCIPDCPEETEERRRVCINRNETWPSDCMVHQQRCLCDANAPGCLDPENSHIHIDYFGSCREQRECTQQDMEDFSERMRDWLFNVMRDLAERDELTEHYMQMELEAESNLTRRWVNAAIWKWCDLDGDNDRTVSRHELFPIRAPLVSLEHCMAPFLIKCDPNHNHRITLAEWGNCLKINQEDLHERCEDILKTVPNS